MGLQVALGKNFQRFGFGFGLLFFDIIFLDLLEVGGRGVAVEGNQNFVLGIEQIILKRFRLVVGPFVIGLDPFVSGLGQMPGSQGPRDGGQSGKKCSRERSRGDPLRGSPSVWGMLLSMFLAVRGMMI